jgi:hypothetical protein
MCTKRLGAINLSFPIRARPVALILFSPFSVRGRSVMPVCLPFNDHSVSPWRMTKTRGVVMVVVSHSKSSPGAVALPWAEILEELQFRWRLR